MSDIIALMWAEFLEERTRYLQLREQIAAIHSERKETERRIRTLTESFIADAQNTEAAGSNECQELK